MTLVWSRDVFSISFVTFSSLFFYFEHWSRWCGEGSSRARVRAYMHARTRMRARNIPSPSFARGSLHGAQALQGGSEENDDVSRAECFFVPPLSRFLLTLDPAIPLPFLAISWMEEEALLTRLLRRDSSRLWPEALLVLTDLAGQADERCWR